jgi:hypothetical protein
VLGYCFLNDMGCELYYLKYPRAEDILRKIDDWVRFFDDARFRPYWEDADWQSGIPPGVVMSAYVHPAEKRAALVLLNPGEQSVSVTVRLDGAKLFGAEVVSVTDAETGRPLERGESGWAVGETARHGVRFLLCGGAKE